MSFIWDWANENGGVLALLSLALTLLVLGVSHLAKYTRGVPAEQMLRDPASWQTLAQTYQSTGSDAYFASLERILGYANHWYGEKLLSWRAYGTCLTLAFLYPVLALLIGWAAFNIWEPAGIEFFRNIDSGLDRAWRLALYLAVFGASIYIAKNVDNLARFLVSLIFTPLDDLNIRHGVLAKTVRLLVKILAFFGPVALAAAALAIGTFAFAHAGFFVLAFAGVIAGAFAYAGAYFFAISFAGGFAIAITIATSATLTSTGEISGDTALLLLLFYVILPLLNAGADLLSLAITRFFLAKVLSQKPAAWVILVQMLLDLLLAAACLLLLLASLITALELWAAISPTTVPLAWRSFWTSIHADPKQGITLYLMATTTLVPTVVHLVAGLGALWTQKSRLLLPVAAKLAAQPTKTPFPEVEIDQMLRTIGRATLWGYAGATIVVILPFTLLLWAGFSLLV